MPSELIISEGARVMFLTNKLFNENLCNGSIGIITKIIDKDNIEVVFPIDSGINQVIVKEFTAYFELWTKWSSSTMYTIISTPKCICI